MDTTTNSGTDEILISLKNQLDKFQTILNLVQNNNLYPSVIFTTENISRLSEQLTINEALVIEAISLLDLLSVLSYSKLGSNNEALEMFVNTIVESRSSEEYDRLLYKEAVNDYYFTSQSDLRSLLHSNRLLVAIYIVALVDFIFL